jgi:hypothetical protein
MNSCMMGCDPVEGGGGERFYVVVMEELTIYGHTIDEHTKAKYPDDFAATEFGRAEGSEFACWHSVMCPDGEIGSQLLRMCRPSTYEEFIQARDEDWPELLDEAITQPGPISAVGYYDKDGKPVVTWDSLHGDRA